MSPATKLVPGSFCWFELATSDQEKAKHFYQSIFGWSVEDSPIGPSEMYSMFKIDGKDVAAGYTMRPEQKAMGMPPNWMVYVLVADADKSAARAKQLGGTVHVEPFDVIDHGRMSVIQDPTGASFCIWQSIKHTGVGLKGEHGTVVWADLSTPDQAKAAKFYSDLFGWKMLDGEMKPAKSGDYFHIVNGQEYIGGVQPSAHRDPNAHPAWLIYVDVADSEATVKKVVSLGGRVIMPTMKMGEARQFAVLADPQGAVFALVQELGGKETSERPKPLAKAKAVANSSKPAAKAPAKKAAATKTPARKAPAKKAPAKKAAVKRAAVKKAPARNAAKAKPSKTARPAKKAAVAKKKSKPAKKSATKAKPAKKGQRKR